MTSRIPESQRSSDNRAENRDSVPIISGWEVTMNSYDNEDYHQAHTGTKVCVPHLPAVQEDNKEKLEIISGWETTIKSLPHEQ